GGGTRAGASTARTGTAHRTSSATHRTAGATRHGGTVSGNRNATVNNVNVNRNVNVHGNGYGYGGGYRPVARAATVGAVAVTRGAIIGSAYHSLPSSWATVLQPPGTYPHCGSAWYHFPNGVYVFVRHPSNARIFCT